jgi:trans-2-enoyl-CoA reductase
MKARAIVLHQHGDPPDVARCEQIEVPPLMTGQVRIRMLFAPINPADLNVLQGTYATLPMLPAVPGGEGVGEIEEIGTDVSGFNLGDRVLLPAGLGSWRERLNIEGARLIRVPAGIEAEQAAMLRVNPATAYRMLHDFVPLAPGDWVIQNASNSGVGRSVIQICAAKGWRTINLVRREELVAELEGVGAEAVIVEGDQVEERVKQLTGDAPVLLALNAVGGESALRLANALSAQGTLVTYGAMGRKPLRVTNAHLIFKDLRVRGFWVTQWYQEATIANRDAMFAELFELSCSKRLYTPIDAVFGLEDVVAALTRAGEGGRSGKVLFRP